MSGSLSAGSSQRNSLSVCLLAIASGLLAVAGPQAVRAQPFPPDSGGILGSTYTAVYSDPNFPLNPPVSAPPCPVSDVFECGPNPGFFDGVINPGPYSIDIVVFAVPFPQQFTQVELDFAGAPPIVDATLILSSIDFAITSLTFTPTSLTFFMQNFFGPVSFASDPQDFGIELTLPEPGSLAVLGCGLLGLGLLRRRRAPRGAWHRPSFRPERSESRNPGPAGGAGFPLWSLWDD